MYMLTDVSIFRNFSVQFLPAMQTESHGFFMLMLPHSLFGDYREYCNIIIMKFIIFSLVFNIINFYNFLGLMFSIID